MQTRINTSRSTPLMHTFPVGDESCKQLTEVCTGVCILFSQRKRFHLGTRAAVSEVGLSKAVGVSFKEGCSTHTGKDTHKSKCHMRKLSVISIDTL